MSGDERSGALAGRRVVVPESRALDLFSGMIARHGAVVVRCPLVATCRLQDSSALDAWLDRLVGGAHDLLVFYTGEGVNRILDRAEELGRRDAVVAGFGRVQVVARGPKPVAALRQLGLGSNVTRTGEPTTDGLLALIRGLDLEGRTVGVQIYPGAPEEQLAEALGERGARFDPVLPYAYASDEEDARVAEVIRAMAAGEIDLIAFTSQMQIKRLIEVAGRRDLGPALDEAFRKTVIAAVGPITAEAVEAAGGKVAIQPESTFHMKPLVAEIVQRFDRGR